MTHYRKRVLQAVAALCLGLGPATSSDAAVVFFTDRASWLAAAGSLSFQEDFESFLVDTPFRDAPVALNGMSIVKEGYNGNNDFRNEIDVLPIQFPPPNNSNVASLYTDAPEGMDPGIQVRITFNDLNLAFGFDSWLGSVVEGTTLEVYNGATLLGSQELDIADGAFLGYILTGGDIATSVRFRSTDYTPGTQGEGFNIDNLAGVNAPTPVPEPSSLALLAMALVVGLGVRSRRMRQFAH